MTTMDIKDQKKLVQMLLSRGADPSCKNDEGHLPREVAKNAEVSLPLLYYSTMLNKFCQLH